MAKAIKLERRAFLKGVGVACALPYMECMAAAPVQQPAPKRLCFMSFPNGVSLPEDEAYKEWRWFPEGEGKNYKLTNVLSSLSPYRQDMTVLGGLSHPKSRKLLGHLAGDTFLTGGDLRGNKYLNNISVDQVAAQHLKQYTRYPSLSLSADGGVGYKSRVSTLSFDSSGLPIPTEHRHRAIFERYFSPSGGGSSAERRRSIAQNKKIVDMVLEDSRSLRQQLGQLDKHKLDQYLTSLNEVEEQIKRNEQWLDIPLKHFDSDHLQLDVDGKIDPQSHIRSLMDLMVIGYQTDMTRVMTYMIAREDGMGIGDNFPKLALGLKRGHHGISHDKTTGHWLEWGKYDQWMASNFAYFIGRMKETEDEYGSLLDSTLVLYGSPCSTTHNANNCPLVLAGGSQLGVKHGSYTRFDDHTPLTNLFVSMLNAVDVKTNEFSDSTGPLPEVFTA